MESNIQYYRSAQLIEDQYLWLSLKSDDSLAFEQLFNKYYKKLYFYGLKLTGSHSQVSDAIQDVFANIWETRSRLSRVTYVKAYLFSILKYGLLKLKPKEILDKSNIDNHLIKGYSFDISPEELYISKESQLKGERIIEDLLINLSSKQKEIIYLKFYNNYSNIEISAILSIKPQSVANLLSRTLDRLRKKKNNSNLTIKTVSIES